MYIDGHVASLEWSSRIFHECHISNGCVIQILTKWHQNFYFEYAFKVFTGLNKYERKLQNKTLILPKFEWAFRIQNGYVKWVSFSYFCSKNRVWWPPHFSTQLHELASKHFNCNLQLG